MHDRANSRPLLCVALFGGISLDAVPYGLLACRTSCLGASLITELAWALTQEWALSIHAAKNKLLGAYPAVGACPGHYCMRIIIFFLLIFSPQHWYVP